MNPNPVISAEEAAKLAAHPGVARGLPRKSYFDPEFHEAELQHVFRENWVFAAIEADIAAPNSLRPVTVGGAPVLLVRDSKSELRAFHNVCRHRGAMLATEPCAKVKRLMCPYHCWTYDLNGKLLATPHIGGHHQHKHDDFDKSTHGLLSMPVAVWAGMVFVNVSGTAPAFDDWLAPLIARWAPFDLSLLRHGGVIPFNVKANWKLAIENFAESYHLPNVHPGLTSYSPLEAHFDMRLSPQLFGQGSLNYAPSPIDGRKLPVFPDIAADIITRAEYPILFPNAMIGLHSDHFFALIAHPTSPTTCVEEMHVWFIGDQAMDDRYAANRKDVADRWKQINLEDMGVVESMQVGRYSPVMDGGVFSPALDLCVYDFQNEVARRVLDGRR